MPDQVTVAAATPDCRKCGHRLTYTGARNVWDCPGCRRYGFNGKSLEQERLDRGQLPERSGA